MDANQKPVGTPFLRVLVIGLGLAALAALGVWHAGGVREAEVTTWDMMEARLSPVVPDERLMLIEVDRTSYELFDADVAAAPVLRHVTNGFPWSRDVWAEMINKICGAGARLVISDVLFSRSTANDAALRATLERWGDRVVLAGNLKEDMVRGTVQFQWQPPTPALTDGLPVAVGAVNLRSDRDGRVRHYSFQLDRGLNEMIPSVAAAALERLGQPVPQDQNARLRFPALGARRIERRTVAEVLVPALWTSRCADGAVFQDKVVLFGPTAPELHDIYSTPVGYVSGPELHLLAINSAWQGGGWRESGWGSLALALALALAAAVIPVVKGWRARLRLVWHLGVTLIAGVGAVLALRGPGWLVLVWVPLAVFHATGLAGFALEFLHTVLERRRTREMLERYVSRNVARALLDNRDAWMHRLGGERREVTVLFADLVGFTSASEHADPHEIIAQLNEFLSAAVRTVFATEGTLDKFIGDAVMAVWSNLESSQRPAQAVTTGLAMLEEMAACNERWQERGWPALGLGVGITTGLAIVGNVGSEGKQDFTVVGDTVNLASRLQDLSRRYPATLVIGEATAASVADTHVVLAIDRVRVKGRTQPLTISTVLGTLEEVGERSALWRSAYDAALVQEQAGDFTAAGQSFNRLSKESWSGLGGAVARALAGFHAKRCETLAAQPPPEWDGVWVWTDK